MNAASPTDRKEAVMTNLTRRKFGNAVKGKSLHTVDSENSKNNSAKPILAAAGFILVLLLIFAIILGPAFRISEPASSSAESESTSTASPDSSANDSDTYESNNSNTHSYDSNDSNSSAFVDDEDTLGVELDDGSTVYQDGDGNYYYVNPDGSIEATDGWGNVGVDSDADGEFDSYSTDGGETWHSWD